MFLTQNTNISAPNPQNQNVVRKDVPDVKLKDGTLGNLTNGTPSIKKAIKEFCETTSMHGFSVLLNAGNKIIKGVWLVIVLIAFTGLTIHVSAIIKFYLEYKTTQYNYVRESGYWFPDVTICNQNGISDSNLRAAAKIYLEIQCFLNKLKSLQNENSTKDGDCKLNKIPSNREIQDALGNKAKEIGHTFEDMILSCDFLNQPCNQNDFASIEVNSLFNCYTFNKYHNNVLKSEGGHNGLSLILYLEPTEISYPYDSKVESRLGNTDGFKMVLHPAKTLPPIFIRGIDMAVGQSISVAFKAEEYVKHPAPYSSCKHTDWWYQNEIYSFEECRNKCIHQKVIHDCGCFPTAYYVRTNYTSLGIPSCVRHLFSDPKLAEEMLDCQIETIKHMNIDFKDNCGCFSPCIEGFYVTFVSSAEWPSQNSINTFLDFLFEPNSTNTNLKAYQYYQNLLSQNASQEIINTWIRRHFLRINVFANTRFVSVKEDVPMFTMIRLLCDIGGSMGLWLGFSLVTFFEVLQLFLSLMYVMLNRVLRKQISS